MNDKNKQNQDFVPLFSTIISDVNDVAHVQQFSGINFVYVTQLTPAISMVHNLAMQPRVYPLAEHAERGEPETPGSYQCSIFGTAYDMMFSVKANQLWIPEMSLTVPLHNSSITLTYNIDTRFSSTISAEAVMQHKFFSFEGVCRALDNFSNGSYNVNIATRLKKLTMGFSFSRLLSEKNYAIKSVIDIPIKNTTVGASVTKDMNDDLLIISSARTTFNNTTAGIGFFAYPKVLQSNVFLGYGRSFMASSVSTTISLSGVVSTFYSRMISANKRISLSASADLRSRKYDIGIDFNLSP